MSCSKSKRIKLVQCKICNVTAQKRHLSQHMQTHEEGHFLCDICGVFKGKRKDTLQGHKKVVHNVGNESINDCIFCLKKLPSFAKLEIHLRSHTMERPFFCKLCPNESSVFQSAQSHTRRFHSLRKLQSFYCSICSKEFREKAYLRRHLKFHFVSVANLPFKCDVCSKAFRSNGNLNIHKRVHSKEKPFPCEICNVAFSQAGALKAHIRVHTGEKPFTCAVCKKGFVDSCALRKHMRTHSGEKPFPCKDCKVAYSERRYLQAHLKRFHCQN